MCFPGKFCLSGLFFLVYCAIVDCIVFPLVVFVGIGPKAHTGLPKGRAYSLHHCRASVATQLSMLTLPTPTRCQAPEAVASHRGSIGFSLHPQPPTASWASPILPMRRIQGSRAPMVSLKGLADMGELQLREGTTPTHHPFVPPNQWRGLPQPFHLSYSPVWGEGHPYHHQVCLQVEGAPLHTSPLCPSGLGREPSPQSHLNRLLTPLQPIPPHHS